MKKTLFVLTLLMAAIATYFYVRNSNTAARDRLIAIQATTEIDRSNKILTDRSLGAFYALKEDLADPYTHSQAAIWEPRAIELRRLSTAICDQIDSLKSKLNTNKSQGSTYTSGDAGRLFDSLIKFKAAFIATFASVTNVSDLVNIDLKNIRNEFQKRVLPILSASKSSNWAVDNFKGISVEAATLQLTGIQNEVLMAEMAGSEYLSKQIQGRGGDVIYIPHCFACLNAQVLRKGQRLKAYIYLFNMNYYGLDPEVRINGARQILSKENEVDYSQRVTSIGKHELKVNVQFLQPDSSHGYFSKLMTYEVVP